MRTTTKENKDINDVQLVFRKPSKKVAPYGSYMGGGTDIAKDMTIQLNKLLEAFKDFKVDTIELSIEFGIQSGTVLQLFVSAEGKGGCKVTLKPKG